MRQKWKDFAQRRKINLEMFEAMTYQDYVRWCEIRKVEPVEQDSYEGVRNILKKPPPAPVLDVATISILVPLSFSFLVF